MYKLFKHFHISRVGPLSPNFNVDGFGTPGRRYLMIEPCHWPSKHIPNIEVRGEGGNTATMDFWVFDHFVHLLTKMVPFQLNLKWTPLAPSAC